MSSFSFFFFFPGMLPYGAISFHWGEKKVIAWNVRMNVTCEPPL